MIRRTCYLVVAAVLLCLVFPSCAARPPVSAGVVLEAMRDGGGDRMNGILRTRSSSLDDPAYLTDILLSALYGEAARGWLSDYDGNSPLINDAAILLPASRHPCELAVFRCSDVRGAATVAAVCRARLDAIRRAWRGSEWEDMVEDATVAVEREYVLLIVVPDVETALGVARRAIG